MIESLRQLLKERTTEFYIFLILLWVLPGVGLLILGLVFLYQHGWFWWFSAGMVMLALITLAVRFFLSRKEQAQAEPLTHLDPIPDWSTNDNRAWEQSLAHIAEARLFTTAWEEVPKAMLDQLSFVARLYHKDDAEAQYAFSLPELLLMLETWSREYRAHVIEHVPLSQNIKISTLRSLNQKKESLQRIYQMGGPLITVGRILLDPAGGITSEIRSRMLAELSSGFSEHMQKNMKQVLFEQVTQVAIDLYSGRLKLNEEELAAYRQAQEPPQEVVIHPLSVMVVALVIAGKSSVSISVKARSVAEVDVMPSTEGFHPFRMLLSDELDIFLIDTPGLDGSAATAKVLLKEAVNADLVLWLSQANQPAKELDKQLLDQFSDYFSENLGRKKPPIVLVSTHNDLLPPTGSWNPPYDLNDTSDPKAAAIAGALDYAFSSIGFPKDSARVPISQAPGREPYNVDVLQDILLSVSSEARAAQLNKERWEAADRSSVVRKGLRQTASLLKWGVGVALK